MISVVRNSARDAGLDTGTECEGPSVNAQTANRLRKRVSSGTTDV